MGFQLDCATYWAFDLEEVASLCSASEVLIYHMKLVRWRLVKSKGGSRWGRAEMTWISPPVPAPASSSSCLCAVTQPTTRLKSGFLSFLRCDAGLLASSFLRTVRSSQMVSAHEGTEGGFGNAARGCLEHGRGVGWAVGLERGPKGPWAVLRG